MFGPEVHYIYKRFRPYGDFMIGPGNITYRTGQTDNSIVYEFGGGVEAVARGGVADEASEEVVDVDLKGHGQAHQGGLVGDREQLANVLGKRACADVVEVGRSCQRRGRRGASGVDHVAGAVDALPSRSGGVGGFG